MEKTRKYEDSIFTMFVDLKKAYGLLPRNALWTFLACCSMPPTMLNIIRFFYNEWMQAGVRVF